MIAAEHRFRDCKLVLPVRPGRDCCLGEVSQVSLHAQSVELLNLLRAK
jgi:hypothetical protein